MQGPITFAFGWHGQRYHAGIDITAPAGTPIRAAGAGTITYAGWYYGYGRTVIIDHGGGVSTLYGHGSQLLVRSGEAVKRGQSIARVGCTGRCTGPHVHFETRVQGRAVDPLHAPPAAGLVAPSEPSLAETPALVTVDRPSNHPVIRTTVTVTGDTTTTVSDTIQDGQVVRRYEETIAALGPVRVRVLREFQLVDGVLWLVQERTHVYVVGHGEEDSIYEESDEEEEDVEYDPDTD